MTVVVRDCTHWHSAGGWFCFDMGLARCWGGVKGSCLLEIYCKGMRHIIGASLCNQSDRRDALYCHNNSPSDQSLGSKEHCLNSNGGRPNLSHKQKHLHTVAADGRKGHHSEMDFIIHSGHSDYHDMPSSTTQDVQ